MHSLNDWIKWATFSLKTYILVFKGNYPWSYNPIKTVTHFWVVTLQLRNAALEFSSHSLNTFLLSGPISALLRGKGVELKLGLVSAGLQKLKSHKGFNYVTFSQSRVTPVTDTRGRLMLGTPSSYQSHTHTWSRTKERQREERYFCRLWILNRRRTLTGSTKTMNSSFLLEDVSTQLEQISQRATGVFRKADFVGGA